MSQSARISLSTKDVIHIEGFQGTASVFKNESTMRIRSILQQLQSAFSQSGMDLNEINALMEQGIPCEVLQPGAEDWQAGAMRLSLEFQPGAAIAMSAPAIQSEVDLGRGDRAGSFPLVSSAERHESMISPSEGGSMTMSELAMPDDLSDLEMGDADLNLESMNSMDSLGTDSLGHLSMENLSTDSSDEEFGLSGLEESESDNLQNMMGSAGFGDDLSDGLSLDVDELSLDLDSQAVATDNIDDLTSPWDLSGDLDEMMLQNTPG